MRACLGSLFGTGSSRRAFAVVCALTVLPMAAVLAQQPTFKSGTRVVSLFVTVFDAQRRLVPDLTQEEFEVYDSPSPSS